MVSAARNGLRVPEHYPYLETPLVNEHQGREVPLPGFLPQSDYCLVPEPLHQHWSRAYVSLLERRGYSPAAPDTITAIESTTHRARSDAPKDGIHDIDCLLAT